MTGITYGIIISIENYNESTDFPKVDFASKDAQDFTEALLELGYNEDDFLILSNEKATKTAILSKVKKFVTRVTGNDRIIFYFAGHGFYEEGQNLIAPVDAITTDKKGTCIPLLEIVDFLRTSQSSKNILFLDCCHSGFLTHDKIREAITSFKSEELIYQYGGEEFCVGYASCKSDEESISHLKLHNGVWTHFLVKALSGYAGNIYEEGLLFSDKLQSYLRKETSEFVKLHTTKKRDQTPVKFGSETDKFIIADLTAIFEEREKERMKKELEEQAASFSFEDISFISEEDGSVKSLPGFIRGRHSVPSRVNSTANNFIKSIGHKIIQEEISEISQELQKHLKYSRAKLKATTDNGSGSIETPDFDYSIEIYQSEEDSGTYVLSRKIEYIKNPEIINNPLFNRTFNGTFDNLRIAVHKKIDIAKFIDKIEALEESELIDLDYDPSDLSSCTLSISGNSQTILVTGNSICFQSNSKTSPAELVEAYKKTQQALILSPVHKMLNQ
ncbi:MAG: caspase family protein [Bacteroidetes bacterium]|nr:caspase family protein [Bacteroidota bacterium]